MEQKKLSTGTKLGYGIADFGGCLFFASISFILLNYLTDTVGLAAALAGIALMVGRIWDAFYDPIIGFISDRTATKMGRQRPFMLGGAVPMFIAMIIMFTNPALVFGSGISQTALFIYALIVYIILCTAYSTVNIPYTSWYPELTADYHERTSLNGYRFGFAVLGTLVGAGAALPIIGLCADKSMGFILMGLVFGSVMLFSTLTTVFTVKEPASLKPAKSLGFRKTYLEVFRNKPYLLLLFTYILHLVAMTMVSGIAIYYFKYVLDAEEMTTYALLILLVTAMLFIPVSVLISKKTGKKFVYAASFAIMALTLLVLFFFGAAQGVNFTLVTMFFMGIGFGLTYVPPYAMVADAIEYDYLRVGERREGAFFGIWQWGNKIGQALAVFSMGVILQAIGYVANVMPQPEQVQLGIRLFMGPNPAGIFIIATLILSFYPIDEKRYKEICDQIAFRELDKATQK